MSRRNLLNRQFKPACEKLKLTGIGWHWLRHTTATLSDSLGVPLGTVQTLLGHSSQETTRALYVHAVGADVKEAVQRVEDLMIGPKRTQVPDFPELTNTLIH